MPPSASAASCRTISDSEPSWRTFKRAGTECVERSCPKTKAISCLLVVRHYQDLERHALIKLKTHLNRALSSVKPAASASTASAVPTFLRANIARYRSNKGILVSKSVVRRVLTSSVNTPVGLGLPESRPELGGAGSIDV